MSDRIDYICVKTFTVGRNFLDKIIGRNKPRKYEEDWTMRYTFKKGIVYHFHFSDAGWASELPIINIYDENYRLGILYSNNDKLKNFKPYQAWWRDKQIDSILE